MKDYSTDTTTDRDHSSIQRSPYPPLCLSNEHFLLSLTPPSPVLLTLGASASRGGCFDRPQTLCSHCLHTPPRDRSVCPRCFRPHCLQPPRTPFVSPRVSAGSLLSYQQTDGVVAVGPFGHSIVSVVRNEDVQLSVDEHGVTATDLIVGRSRSSSVDDHSSQRFPNVPEKNPIVQAVENVHSSVAIDIDRRGIVEFSSTGPRAQREACNGCSDVRSGSKELNAMIVVINNVEVLIGIDGHVVRRREEISR